jgi:hypothetical protein
MASNNNTDTSSFHQCSNLSWLFTELHVLDFLALSQSKMLSPKLQEIHSMLGVYNKCHKYSMSMIIYVYKIETPLDNTFFLAAEECFTS